MDQVTQEISDRLKAGLLPTVTQMRLVDEIAESVEEAQKVGTTLPADVKLRHAARLKILAGLEFGIPPMTAIYGLMLGRNGIGMSANLMAALVERSGRGRMEIVEADEKRCLIRCHRDGKIHEVEFTWDDAVRAKLAGRDTYKSYPEQMLAARCATKAARRHFPDCLVGHAYSHDELDMAPPEKPNEVAQHTASTPAEPTPHVCERVGDVQAASDGPGPEPPAAGEYHMPIQLDSGDTLSRCHDEPDDVADVKAECNRVIQSMAIKPVHVAAWKSHMGIQPGDSLSEFQSRQLYRALGLVRQIYSCATFLNLTPEQIEASAKKRGAAHPLALPVAKMHELADAIWERLPFAKRREVAQAPKQLAAG